jgi:hypothetical protein
MTFGANGTAATFADSNYFGGTELLQIVPEPASWKLMAGGTILLLLGARKVAMRRRARLV